MGIAASFRRRSRPPAGPGRRRPRRGWLLPLAAAAGLAIAGGLAFPDRLPSLTASAQKAERFSACGNLAGRNCVIDGDTFYYRGEKIRIADIDAPETGGAQCNAEAELGARATRRLRELLNEGPFELRGFQSRDLDRYGRKLRIVVRDGASIGERLVAEGLARRWRGRRMPWCT